MCPVPLGRPEETASKTLHFMFGRVARAYNTTTQETEQKDVKFKVILGYSERQSQKKKKKISKQKPPPDTHIHSATGTGHLKEPQV